MNILTPTALIWLQTLLSERYNHLFHFYYLDSSKLVLCLPNSEKSITFDNLQSIFYSSQSDFACQQWQASTENFTAPIDDLIPAPSATKLMSPLIEFDEKGATVHYDMLGLTYWMLNRLEEIGSHNLDNHQRFPATSSHAYRHGYLERPIIDEWLIILGQVIQRVWPQLVLKQHKFSIKVSHDVDRPSYAYTPWLSIGRIMMDDLIKDHKIRTLVTTPYLKLTTRMQLHSADPYNTFDWLMDVSEANNLQSAFYFICGCTDIKKDAVYKPEYSVIRKLMCRIHNRGHEIGLHPSYGTYQRPAMIQYEAERLKKVCLEENITQAYWRGGRMHYLRWEHPTTLQAWNDAGMDYDSTLGYADHPGFRCGSCFEYPAFNPITQQLLVIRIRPLIVMEVTIIESAYLGLGTGDKALNRILKLKEVCYRVNGCFTLLWHNSSLISNELKELYQYCLNNKYRITLERE
ncbi:MAG TPA: polysaccharide deacetylase family protein [Arsenophonus sp.]